ncbi:uncharacterized protein BJ171DRAFT_254912 [Polychytrium aggregatum]|uniref:uncharacterized protein n=1 Tax=Polychytrium aggregatum TaxID=110093 RepID=UPI0022FE9F43|nr:uncharacterized protein BJ171DRAFT_254912 [Polychytrium aggregatum]KAI9207765.1 hypothetical protein BJ171DRAFT_254912 [Polychytrium aggregatum]
MDSSSAFLSDAAAKPPQFFTLPGSSPTPAHHLVSSSLGMLQPPISPKLQRPISPKLQPSFLLHSPLLNTPVDPLSARFFGVRENGMAMPELSLDAGSVMATKPELGPPGDFESISIPCPMSPSLLTLQDINVTSDSQILCREEYELFSEFLDLIGSANSANTTPVLSNSFLDPAHISQVMATDGSAPFSTPLKTSGSLPVPFAPSGPGLVSKSSQLAWNAQTPTAPWPMLPDNSTFSGQPNASNPMSLAQSRSNAHLDSITLTQPYESMKQHMFQPDPFKSFQQRLNHFAQQLAPQVQTPSLMTDAFQGLSSSIHQPAQNPSLGPGMGFGVAGDKPYSGDVSSGISSLVSAFGSDMSHSGTSSSMNSSQSLYLVPQSPQDPSPLQPLLDHINTLKGSQDSLSSVLPSASSPHSSSALQMSQPQPPRRTYVKRKVTDPQAKTTKRLKSVSPPASSSNDNGDKLSETESSLPETPDGTAVKPESVDGAADFLDDGLKKKDGASRKRRELLTEQEKKFNHIMSEQRRRNLIREGFETLNQIVPGLKEGSSKSTILNRTVEFTKELETENMELLKTLHTLQNQLQLNRFRSSLAAPQFGRVGGALAPQGFDGMVSTLPAFGSMDIPVSGEKSWIHSTL